MAKQFLQFRMINLLQPIRLFDLDKLLQLLLLDQANLVRSLHQLNNFENDFIILGPEIIILLEPNLMILSRHFQTFVFNDLAILLLLDPRYQNTIILDDAGFISSDIGETRTQLLLMIH